MKHRRVWTFFVALSLVLAQFPPFSSGTALATSVPGSTTAPSDAGLQPGEEVAANTWTIEISDQGFSPTLLTITLGDQVEWHNSTGQDQILRSGTPSQAGGYHIWLPLVVRGTSAATSAGQAAAEPNIGNATTLDATIPPGGVFAYTFTSLGEHLFYLANTPAHTGRIVVQAPNPGPDPDLPPDPADVALPLDPSVASSLADSTAFLYTGTNPIQTGVAPGTIEAKRAAVLRGIILDRTGQPISGVTITILDHPEFGQTLSRADGMFDLAVNGGGVLTVNYDKGGYLPAQRQVQAPWRDYAWLPEVVLIPLDSRVTTIDLSANVPIQVAQGRVVSDSDGIRQATLLVPQGTAAEMLLPDGTIQPLPSLSIRVTEYTVGDSGPQAMPGDLPPTSGYTYALEYSVDEALAGGAIDVRFSQPVIHYVDNYLAFPVGMVVPAGYYDRRAAAWVPADNGRVVSILAFENGLARLDTTGDGQADDGAAIGVTDAERANLITLYQPGQSLWRVPLSHFTPWDLNWPYGPPADAASPGQPMPTMDIRPNRPDCQGGSIIECQSQILGEAVNIAGTPFRLFYTSERVPGRKTNYTLDIQLSGSAVPGSLRRIDLQVLIAGRLYPSSYPAAPNQRTTFTWDGRDAYGRLLQGEQPATIRIGYVYGAVYQSPAAIGRAFAAFGAAMAGMPARQEVVLWQEWPATLGVWRYPASNLGGWALEQNHFYDPVLSVIYLGDGRQHKAGEPIISTWAGNGIGYGGDGGPATQASLSYPHGIAVGPDGSLFIADRNNNRVRRVGPDGVITTVAGVGTSGFYGDGGPAAQAMLAAPAAVAVGPDGSLYIADSGNFMVRRVSPDGIITTVAGTRVNGFSGDGGPATQAKLSYLMGVAVGTDGSLYIADTSNNQRVRRVAPDGIITTVAGNGTPGFGGDGGPASQATLSGPMSVAVAPDGSLYIAEFGNNRIRRIGPDGIITTVAGIGSLGFSGDGGPATQARLGRPRSVALGVDDSLYIAETDNYTVRRVSPDGIITTMAGNMTGGYSGDGGLVYRAVLKNPTGVAVAPDGNVYIADTDNHRVRRVLPPPGAVIGGGVLVPSEDGREVYRFDTSGRHLATLDALTGAVLYQFAYNGAGSLLSVTDGDGNTTWFERDAAGNPAAVVGPDGHRTMLSLDGNGYLSAITDPAGNAYHFSYGADGLLASMTDPRGSVWTFGYDALGRLVRDQDPSGGVKILSRVSAGNSYTVSLTTALSRTTTYSVEFLATGVERRITTDPTGARTETTYHLDGSRTIRYPDGTVEQVTLAPDPRWGMLAPVLQSLVRTLPSGAKETVVGLRIATLADAKNPLSLVSQTDQVTINGQTTTSQYDAATRTLTITGAGGGQRKIVLDDHGRVVRVEATGMDPVVNAFDSRGRLFEESQGTNVWRYNYESPTRLTVTDPAGQVTAYAYDAAARLTGVTLPGGENFTFANDASSNRNGLTLPSGAVHSLAYTPVNLTEGYTPPGAGSYLWSYNPDRQRSLVTLPGGRTIQSLFDSGGRPTGFTYPEASVAFAYVGNTGQVQLINRTPSGGGAGQTLDFSYDGYRLTAVTWGGLALGRFAYTYRPDGELGSLALTSGSDAETIALSYNSDGFLTGYGPFTLVRGGPAGAVSEIRNAASSLAFGYDTMGRWITRTQTVGGLQRFAAQITHTAGGQISQTVQTLAGAGATYRYVYNATGGLMEVYRDGTLVERYTYDANGNRTSRLVGGAAETALYDVQGRLTQRGNVAYSFDSDGFLASRGSDSFQYSARGELLQATAGGQTITYAYDGLGRRVGRTDSAGTTQYLYGNPNDVFQITALRDPAGVLTFFYYDEAGLLFAFKRGGATYYVATDQVGTPRLVSDASGSVVKTLAHDSFGVLLSDSNPAFDLPIGFAGGLADSTTGLVRIGLRDYEPLSGRWTARDAALFQANQTNLYAYAGNDPVNQRDVGGLFSVSASAYALLGLGVKFAVTGQGFSFCWEGGVGAGADVELDPFGDLDSDGLKAGAEIEATLGPLSAKKAVRYDDCGRSNEDQVCIGPFCSSSSGDTVKGGPDDLAQSIRNMFKWSRVGLQAKAVFGYCMGGQW